MKRLTFWKELTDDFDDEGNQLKDKMQWFCTDGISIYFGDTKADAASHFGVPIGF
jgi:hypothetical protein